MKIKDFNAKVRIGSTVYIGDRKVTVQDIDRRTHSAFFKWRGWVRCSEFEPCTDLGVQADGRKWNYRRPVIAHFPDGTQRVFRSAREAARQTGLSLSTISNLCRNGKRNRQGIGFEYIGENRSDVNKITPKVK